MSLILIASIFYIQHFVKPISITEKKKPTPPKHNRSACGLMMSYSIKSTVLLHFVCERNCKYVISIKCNYDFFLAVCERFSSWHLSLSRDQWCWLGFVSPIYHYRLSIIVYVRVYMVLTGSCYAETTPWFYSDDILDRLAAVDYICQKSTFPFPSK